MTAQGDPYGDAIELALALCLLAYQAGHSFDAAVEAGRAALEPPVGAETPLFERV